MREPYAYPPPHGARQRGGWGFPTGRTFLLKRKHRVNRVCPPISCAQKHYPSLVLFSEAPQVYRVGGAADLLLFDGVFATARRRQIITLHTVRLRCRFCARNSVRAWWPVCLRTKPERWDGKRKKTSASHVNRQKHKTRGKLILNFYPEAVRGPIPTADFPGLFISAGVSRSSPLSERRRKRCFRQCRIKS